MARAGGKAGVQFGPPVRGKQASTRAESGRMCDAPGCTAVLSTYNASTTCWPHTTPAYRPPLHRS